MVAPDTSSSRMSMIVQKQASTAISLSECARNSWGREKLIVAGEAARQSERIKVGKVWLGKSAQIACDLHTIQYVPSQKPWLEVKYSP